MDDDITISFMPYTIDNLQLIKGWNVLISPEGIVYKVYEFNKLITFHDEYSKMLMEHIYNINIKEKFMNLIQKNEKLKHMNLGAKDMVVNIEGFVNFEVKANKVEVTIPNYSYAGHKITNKQYLVLCELARINNLSRREIENQIIEQENTKSFDVVTDHTFRK